MESTQTQADLINKAKKFTGWRDLSQEEINLIHASKAVGEGVGDFFAILETSKDVDRRWLAIARTTLQQGFMQLTRAIAKPEGF